METDNAVLPGLRESASSANEYCGKAALGRYVEIEMLGFQYLQFR